MRPFSFSLGLGSLVPVALRARQTLLNLYCSSVLEPRFSVVSTSPENRPPIFWDVGKVVIWLAWDKNLSECPSGPFTDQLISAYDVSSPVPYLWPNLIPPIIELSRALQGQTASCQCYSPL